MPVAWTRRSRAALVGAAILAVAACSHEVVDLPPDPPGVEAAREDSFTETVRTAARLAREAVAAQLASRFGTDLRVLSRSVDSDAEPAAIRDHYGKALAGRGGWAEFPLLDPPGAWSFAYTSPDGRSVVAVVVLNPRFAPEGGGNVPLTILTNLPEKNAR